ncbi:MAG TPA: hypothetical protein VM577_07755, partial [Anaerovoracaceae bacterium]|nr:hypothetical protein [Anaerovoracaceae bacterium]
LFLISSGGFALLFTYVVIMATHIRFRKEHGCPPQGKCQMPWYPYSSWVVLICMILIIFSMPFIPGQTSGLIAGFSLIILFAGCYFIQKSLISRRIKQGKSVTQRKSDNPADPAIDGSFSAGRNQPKFSSEYGKELTEEVQDKKKQNKEKGKCNK